MYDSFLDQGLLSGGALTGRRRRAQRGRISTSLIYHDRYFQHANLLQPEHSPLFKLSSMLTEPVIQCPVDMIIGIFKSRTMCFDLMVKEETSDLLEKSGAC